MKNKVLIALVVPEIDEKFNLYIPINKKVGNVIVLLNKAISELTNGEYNASPNKELYNQKTGERYSINILIRETNIRNGTCLILI